MFSVFLLLGGITAFFGSMLGFLLAIIFGSDLWLNVSAGILGLSAGQILEFVMIKEQ